MKGPSKAASPASASGKFGLLSRLAMGYHSCGSAIVFKSSFNFTIFNPLQNEPKDSQGVPSSSKIKLGSIAFHISLFGTD